MLGPDERKAFNFAGDLYKQMLVKSITGEAPAGKPIGQILSA